MQSAKSEKTEKSNPHAGHRERIRKRFLENGLAGFSEHEILEFLLFYVHSRANTNEIGHALISQFGSLKGVLDADYDQLLEVKGVGERGAALIKLLPQIFKVYSTPTSQNKSMKKIDERCEFFYFQLHDEKQEVVLLACLDDTLRLRYVQEVGRGMPDRVVIDPQRLLKAALASGCTNFMLAHNHPMGIPAASYDDIRVTESIQKLLQTVHLRLIDHVIVADGRSISMVGNGSFYIE